nr:succinate dehydrogenase assembly factor 4 [Asticcacaulis excentricus]
MPERVLTPAAQRALAEAAQRRAEAEKNADERPFEEGGPAGLEPTRFGDWERKGIVSDF